MTTITPSLRQPRTTSALTTSRVFVGRSLRLTVRDVETLITAIALPVLLMLLFTYVFGGQLAGDKDSYVAYVTPGIILLCAGYGAAATAVSVSRDMTTGTVNRLRTMPVHAPTVLVGHVIGSLLRNLVATTVVVAVGVAIGYRPDAGPAGWLAAIALIVGWILAVTTLFALIGLFAGSPEAANGYGFIFLFLPYVSSAFVLVATMQSWLQPFARNQPITPVIETIRSLLDGTPVDTSTAVVAVVWIVGITVLSGALVAMTFHRRLRR